MYLDIHGELMRLQMHWMILKKVFVMEPNLVMENIMERLWLGS